MNWGKGIVIGMILFMSFIVTLVVIMVSNKSDLVAEDYYNKELAYNEQFDAMQHYANAGEEIVLDIVKDTLYLRFPEVFRKGKVTVSLSRPDNQAQDTQFELTALEEVMIPTAKMPKGAFDCKITGNYGGKPYEFSKSIMLK
ncbi:MAG: FixH family protein [Fluviicola sp.]|jgi:nitrogen fixation protein FixH